MKTYAHISNRCVRIGGEPHSGWLPEGFPTPRPTPTRELNFEFSIRDDGGGNFLLCFTSEDGSVAGDDWFQKMDEAIEAAFQKFGIQKDEWTFQAGSLSKGGAA